MLSITLICQICLTFFVFSANFSFSSVLSTISERESFLLHACLHLACERLSRMAWNRVSSSCFAGICPFFTHKHTLSPSMTSIAFLPEHWKVAWDSPYDYTRCCCTWKRRQMMETETLSHKTQFVCNSRTWTCLCISISDLSLCPSGIVVPCVWVG